LIFDFLFGQSTFCQANEEVAVIDLHNEVLTLLKFMKVLSGRAAGWREREQYVKVRDAFEERWPCQIFHAKNLEGARRDHGSPFHGTK
jgi:hypothetical protein